MFFRVLLQICTFESTVFFTEIRLVTLLFAGWKPQRWGCIPIGRNSVCICTTSTSRPNDTQGKNNFGELFFDGINTKKTFVIQQILFPRTSHAVKTVSWIAKTLLQYCFLKEVSSFTIKWPQEYDFNIQTSFRISIHLIRIRIQIRNQGFDDQKLKKKNLQLEEKLNFLDQKLLFLGLYKGRPSLQPSKENIQHFKTRSFLIFFYFCGPFLPSWIRILNPYPDLRIHWPDPILIQMRNTDSKVGHFEIKNAGFNYIRN